jgi:hypothetical protein
MATTGDVPKVKGIVFIEALKWYSKTYGQERLVEAAQALPPPLATYITNLDSPSLGLLSGSWYPSVLVESILGYFCKGRSPHEVQRLAAEFGRAGVGNTLNGIYATFMRLLVSPDLVAAHYEKIWRLYMNTGHCEIIIHSPTKHELRVSNWGAHTPLFCQMCMYAAANVLETIGCHRVESTTTACVSRGGKYCAYTLTWEK